mmetsp:Transcript_8577/g.11833  ORF Transcript_8577/g.11833 Transcript_8577/m.11833 type:complete len:82 (-) Transcript_8577:3-248(-)
MVSKLVEFRASSADMIKFALFKVVSVDSIDELGGGLQDAIGIPCATGPLLLWKDLDLTVSGPDGGDDPTVSGKKTFDLDAA